MPISPTGNAGAAMTLLTASEDNAVQERLSRGAGVAKSATGPQERSSAHDKADRTTFSHKYWNPEETIDFSMGTYTKNGTRIQVEAGERGFTLGHFANKGPLESTFNLAGARAPLDMSVTFTTKDGNVTTYKVNKSMTFHETEEGMIIEGKSVGNKVRDPDDPTTNISETNIIFNMDDKGTAVGGTGDDVLFNFGERGYVNGMEGEDTLINMADKANLKGGEGEDFVKIVKDVIRDRKESTYDLEAMGKENAYIDGQKNPYNLNPLLMVGPDGGQDVTVDGGDGNDVIDSKDAKLENATIKGGAGDDSLLLGDLVASTVSGGDGDDEIEVEDALQSKISGGAGNDRIDVGRMKNSHISGGSGDDHISVDRADGGSVSGGAGNDTIDMGVSYRTTVTGGDGDDMISIHKNIAGTVGGGKGDDIIAVDLNVGGVIDGGGGDDLISVRSNMRKDGSGIDWGSSVIMGGRGDDIILVSKSEKSFILGGAGDDTITVAEASNTLISGGGGNDTIRTGFSWDNLIDGGSGKNEITLNKFASPLAMKSKKPHNLTEQDIDMEALALFIKQLTNDGIEPGTEGEGMTLTAAQWMELARERLNKGVPQLLDKPPDVVVDNGKLVQGTPDMLAKQVGKFSEYLETTKLKSGDKRAMKNYLNSIQKLAQSEGAGSIFGKLAK